MLFGHMYVFFWRRKWQPVFLLGESHGQWSLAGYSPWGRKELDTAKQPTHMHTHTYTHTPSLEKCMFSSSVYFWLGCFLILSWSFYIWRFIFYILEILFKFLSILSLFLCMVLGCVVISFFCRSCPVFPPPLLEVGIFSPLYILASFVRDNVSIGVWVYLWAFYCPIDWSVFLFLCQYCAVFDCCSFVVSSEVREPDSSSSVFLSQDGFGFLRSFVFPEIS